MTAAVILYAYFALMLYVGIMGAISHKPKPKRKPDPTAGCAAASTPHHTQE